MTELETKVELLKRELHDQKKIHNRLDVAIEKLTDVSNSIHRMLAVHDEKIARQEEAIVSAEESIETRRIELSEKIDELHSRITTNTKEIMAGAAVQHKQHTDEIHNLNSEINRLRNDINDRVGILEKWRYIIVGGSIVSGFLLHKFINFSP
jgi:chromosome segregation ATPase